MTDHDEAHPCRLSRQDEPPCGMAAVVAIEDRSRQTVWGCEAHAASALSAIAGARIAQVDDWPAARRLLALPWNRRPEGSER